MSEHKRQRPEADLPSGAGEVEDAYSPEYLRECAGGDAREERLAELRRRIRCGAYHVDPERVADQFLSRGAEPEPPDEH